MLDINSKVLTGGRTKLKKSIWEVVWHALQEWTRVDLTPTSLYGIHKYTEGTILVTHVNCFPLVMSAITNVA